ncbi:XRE family transcriptional regulator [Methylobacillus sp. MM3]|uniref:helix-turn-helix domain-containing protein n=1 Tax=Methylobacillus sp. MM3 TaxID=1848039 RepID=UPI0007E128B3|nr:helix-turn-helix transcriptional regulator [Methylobacillus sp. MM3]OAJ71476.1 XRE family transcriptional regulator [Methylobacillus sp. MM3]
MKCNESTILTHDQLQELKLFGERISRLRKARGVLQADAAVRAGISRPTATRIEAGDPGRSLGQVLRYVDAIAPGTSLLDLLLENDPALKALREKETVRRVRLPSEAQMKKLDF